MKKYTNIIIKSAENCKVDVSAGRIMILKSSHEYCTVRPIKAFGVTIGVSVVFSRYSSVTGTLRKYNVHAYGNAANTLVNEVINFLSK